MSKSRDALLERLAAIEGFIFDMDGTLVLGDASNAGFKPLPGALDLITLLRTIGMPFRVFTNGTGKTPAAYAAGLRLAGLPIDDATMMTPSSAAADYFLRKGLRRIRVLGLAGVQGPLRDAGLDVIGPGDAADRVEAVYTGWYRDFVFADLEAACRDIWAGAVLTTASNVPFFATQSGRAIGASFAINAMITSLTGAKATVLGKPSRDAFAYAVAQMGLKRGARIAVVGDDPALEMRMARKAGALAVAVTTGLHDRDGFAALGDKERPDLIFDSLTPILDALA